MLGGQVGEVGDEEGERGVDGRVGDLAADEARRRARPPRRSPPRARPRGRSRRPPTPRRRRATRAASVKAAIAVRRATRAVASLTRDSPSRMVTTRRGSPIRRATAVAATASGGATTAPRAKATANGTGSSHQVTSPTPAAVKSTRPTDSARIELVLARKSTSDVRTAAAYSRGGSRPYEHDVGAEGRLADERHVGRHDAHDDEHERGRGPDPPREAGDQDDRADDGDEGQREFHAPILAPPARGGGAGRSAQAGQRSVSARSAQVAQHRLAQRVEADAAEVERAAVERP